MPLKASEIIMSTDKRQDLASSQLQLFGCEVSAQANKGTPTTFMEPQPVARPGLRLVSSTTTVQLSAPLLPAESLTAIEAKLIGRAKFF
jgi:hypothetical protein